MPRAVEELVCPNCGKDDFETSRGLNRHLNSITNCQVTASKARNEQRLQFGHGMGGYSAAAVAPLASTSGRSFSNDDDMVLDTDINQDLDFAMEEVIEQVQEAAEDEDTEMQEMFHFVEDVVEVEIGEAGPGPSTMAQRRNSQRFRVHVLDEDDDSRVIIDDEDAGQVIKMDESLHQRWQRLLQLSGLPDSGQPQLPPGAEGPNPYAPFTSELEWRIARWAVLDGIGHSSLDRLLSIPGVSLGHSNKSYTNDLFLQVVEKLGLSYHNTRSLHQTIDNDIPERAGTWRTDEIFFNDFPDIVYTVRSRDPLEAIQGLWGDPVLSQHIIYRSKKIFSDKNCQNRIYTEVWTGKWWAAIQVMIIISQ